MLTHKLKPTLFQQFMDVARGFVQYIICMCVTFRAAHIQVGMQSVFWRHCVKFYFSCVCVDCGEDSAVPLIRSQSDSILTTFRQTTSQLCAELLEYFLLFLLRG